MRRRTRNVVDHFGWKDDMRLRAVYMCAAYVRAGVPMGKAVRGVLYTPSRRGRWSAFHYCRNPGLIPERELYWFVVDVDMMVEEIRQHDTSKGFLDA